MTKTKKEFRVRSVAVVRSINRRKRTATVVVPSWRTEKNVVVSLKGFGEASSLVVEDCIAVNFNWEAKTSRDLGIELESILDQPTWEELTDAVE